VRHRGHRPQRDFTGYKNHPSAALLKHGPHVGAGQPYAAPDVDIEHPLPVFIERMAQVEGQVKTQESK